ncbi:hypothetical protein [Fundicoccus culcitae]|uniref:Transposase n=1 Tax=Fundicoccus culcitae TaxID=2969821 RepID=A0ABY5P3B2_9LACT|nr:hypothetical protein [Fundicoccus culcitae]UUX32910.1 hypothetical protein NRE15_08250 [Fundicoccus culcitae]
MKSENPWEATFLEGWLEKAKDYPTKALLTVAVKQLYPEQKNRLEKQQGLLDGSAWSPDSWKN